MDPTPTVTVRPSGTTDGPSTPESDGGAPMPTGGGVPPAVRNLARSVIVRNRSVSSARPSAVALNEITAVWRCDCGRMPAWYLPWNGTGGSTPAVGVSSVRWLAGAGRVAR